MLHACQGKGALTEKNPFCLLTHTLPFARICIEHNCRTYSSVA
jgi:hypothetical protein